jgi:hypothetical protein
VAAVRAFRVELIEGASADEFQVRYDNSSCCLIMERSQLRSWPHGATVDGVLTLDLDADRVLSHVELSWPRGRWPKGRPTVPEGELRGVGLRLPDLSSRDVPMSCTVSVLASDEALVVTFGDAPAIRVRLGDGIHALVSSEILVGFSFALAKLD